MTITRHTIRHIALAALFALAAACAVAQTPIGTVIANRAAITHTVPGGGFPRTDSSNTSAITVQGATLTLAKSVAPSTAVPGDTVTYTIIVGNASVDTVANIVVVDTIPAALAALTTTHGTLTGNALHWNAGTIAPGAHDTVVVRAWIPTPIPAGAVITNTCTASDSAGVAAIASTDLTVGAAPRLIFSKSVSPALVDAGDTLTYRLVLANAGNTILRAVAAHDTLPAGVQFLSAPLGVTFANGVVTVTADSLGAGTGIGVNILVIVLPGLAGGSTIVNTAHAASDLTPASADTASATVRGHASLAFTKGASADTVVYGDTLRYTLRVANTGNLALTNVALVDTLPSTMTFVSATAGSAAGGVFSAAFASLPMGVIDSVTITVRVSGTSNQPVVIRNTARAASDLTPVETASADVLFRAVPEFTLSKRASVDSLVAGNDFSYTIIAGNTGNVPLTAFTVRDTVPGSLANIRVSANASVANGVVTFSRDPLPVGERDTIVVTVTLPLASVPGTTIVNRAHGSSAQTSGLVAQAPIYVSLPPVLTSCRLTLNAAPSRIYGDGTDSAFVTVQFSDTSGIPKPNGTPVFLSAPGMTFSNGRDTITRYTSSGLVVEPVRYRWTGGGAVTLPIVVTGTDPVGCAATDSVLIVFTPGALIGNVRDIRNGAAIAGAAVAVRQSGSPVYATRTSDARGRYLAPLPSSGDYASTITAQDEFLRPVSVATSFTADLSGASPVTPIPNRNSVAGRLYLGPSRQPLAAPGVRIVLADSASGAGIDSVMTDTTGAFSFTGFPAGAYRAVIGGLRYSGARPFHNNGNGEHLLNANIPVQPGAGLVFTKSAPAKVFAGDTLRYTIAFDNRAAMTLHNATIVDTLDARLRFVAATGPYTYDQSSHRVAWTLAGADSGVTASFTVTVIAGDSARSPFIVTNRAVLAGDEIVPVTTAATTLIAIEAELKIWKTVSEAEAAAGDTLTYEVYVENASFARADSVLVTDALPAELDFIAATPQALRLVDGTLYWTADSLVPGENRKYTVTARVRGDLAYGVHEFTNEAHLRWFGGQGTSSLDARSHATTSLLVPYLRVEKQAIRRIVEVGDLALYTITVTNLSAISPAFDVRVVDTPPLGFRYVAGSSFRDTTKIADPDIDGDMTWTLADSIAPGTSVRLTYRLAVGAGALDGTGVNSAFARALTPIGTVMASAVSSDRVEVRAGVFTDRGLVVGKVFYDENENIWQDPGDEGIKGVELMMEDGTRVTTGDDGKFSLPDVAPGEHVLRLRESTLPPGDALLLGYADFANVASSRFVRVPESGIARADFYVRRAPRVSTTIDQSAAVYGAVAIRRIAGPKDVVFVKDERVAPIAIKGTLFEVGKADLKKEAIPTLKALADYAREYPDQFLAISGHTDASPIHTKLYPSNQELSEARAEAVKAYLVTDEGIFPDRITTTGFGPSQPVATNTTKEGRSLNRRVEIMMTTGGRLFENYYRTVRMRVAVSYHGAAAASGLEVRDRLDTAFHFIPGSARLGATPLTPGIDGDLLVWSLPESGTAFDDTLVYDVRVYAPRAGSRPARSSSTLSYTVNGATTTLDASCWTTNVVARTVKNTPVRLVVPGAFVDAETAELTTDALNELQGAADILHAFPNATALIEGHTGQRDPEAKGFSSNVALSKARAAAVFHALVTKFGVDSSRMQTTGWGELKPAPGREKNASNRVEILIDKPETGKETYHENVADSSETLIRTIGEPAPSALVADGDRVVVTLTATSPVPRNLTAIAAADTLPAALVVESVTALRGVDSVWVVGQVVRSRWTTGDSVHMYSVTAMARGAGEWGRAIGIVRTIGSRTVVEAPPPVKLRVEATRRNRP